MNLRNFPLDAQNCTVEIESCRKILLFKPCYCLFPVYLFALKVTETNYPVSAIGEPILKSSGIKNTGHLKASMMFTGTYKVENVKKKRICFAVFKFLCKHAYIHNFPSRQTRFSKSKNLKSKNFVCQLMAVFYLFKQHGYFFLGHSGKHFI